MMRNRSDTILGKQQQLLCLFDPSALQISGKTFALHPMEEAAEVGSGKAEVRADHQQIELGIIQVFFNELQCRLYRMLFIFHVSFMGFVQIPFCLHIRSMDGRSGVDRITDSII